jgi:hypothetical protein
MNHPLITGLVLGQAEKKYLSMGILSQVKETIQRSRSILFRLALIDIH